MAGTYSPSSYAQLQLSQNMHNILRQQQQAQMDALEKRISQRQAIRDRNMANMEQLWQELRLQKLRSGVAMEEVLKEFPFVTVDDLASPGPLPDSMRALEGDEKRYYRIVATGAEGYWSPVGKIDKRGVYKEPLEFAIVVRDGKWQGLLYKRAGEAEPEYYTIAELTHVYYTNKAITANLPYMGVSYGNGKGRSLRVEHVYGNALLCLVDEECVKRPGNVFFDIWAPLPDGDHWFETNIVSEDDNYIDFGRGMRTCDICSKSVSEGFHCDLCSNGDYDVCEDCQRDQPHQGDHKLSKFNMPHVIYKFS